MNFPSLLEQYVRTHFRSLDDSAKLHLRGFAAHCENAWHDAEEVVVHAGDKAITVVADSLTIQSPNPVHVQAVVHTEAEPAETAQPDSKEE